jgi:hypothetical protein
MEPKQKRHPDFVIEGTWSGYRAGQDRVVHRSVHKAYFKRLREWAERTYGITYTDGTVLALSVRDRRPRERVKEERGYMKLIDDCAHYDVCSVEAVTLARNHARSQAVPRV